jgi:hypothetical protein
MIDPHSAGPRSPLASELGLTGLRFLLVSSSGVDICPRASRIRSRIASAAASDAPAPEAPRRGRLRGPAEAVSIVEGRPRPTERSDEAPARARLLFLAVARADCLVQKSAGPNEAFEADPPFSTSSGVRSVRRCFRAGARTGDSAKSKSPYEQPAAPATDPPRRLLPARFDTSRAFSAPTAGRGSFACEREPKT